MPHTPDPAVPPGYPPIAEHGLIGDMHTAALVGTDGTIDWFCCPRFDAPSVFASILDADRGGCWRLAPEGGNWKSKQLYLPDTAVLVTRFLGPAGVGEVVDFMPVPRDGRCRLVRMVSCVRGELVFCTEVRPRFDYGRRAHDVVLSDRGAVFTAGSAGLSLTGTVPLRRDGPDVVARFPLRAGENVTFLLDEVGAAGPIEPGAVQHAQALFEQTGAYWRNWLGRSRYTGRWREMVHRSALTLKLLTYAPTGAIVAAPTMGLPELVGGERNWDYRYTWIRDAAFSLYALLRLGFTDEAAAFMGWLTDRFAEQRSRAPGPLQIMYGIDGRAEIPEQRLDHLAGYRGSAPVRLGNAATDQLQLDIYGELIDSVYLYNKFGRPISHDDWSNLSRVVEWVCGNWDRADNGIWESRGGAKPHTYSRLQSWVAVERAIRIATQRGLPADLGRWTGVRDSIYRRIMTACWNESRQAFVQYEGGEVLDASMLLMPMVKFVAPTDPRWLSTLDAIGTDLVSDSLVYRYHPAASPDGLTGGEGTFSMCSFWYVEALSRAGRVDEARLVFEKMLTYANHLGLFAEEIGPTGDQLGNFPQAFTHLALISAGFTLDRTLNAHRESPTWRP
jgi:GH15 family glucan-1,4-alpha-glucosidase